MKLFSEREGIRSFVAAVDSMKEAEEFVLRMEEDETWPEGSDAVLVLASGEAFLFSDSWEAIA